MSIYRYTCLAVAENLAVSDITANAATLTWTAVEGVTQWEVAIKAGNGEWSTLPDTYTTNSASLTGLTTATNYQVRVRAQCSDTEFGSWSMVQFTTDCGEITDFPWTEDFEGYSYDNFS